MVKNVTFEHGNIVNQLIVNKQHQEADTFVLELVIYFFLNFHVVLQAPPSLSLSRNVQKVCCLFATISFSNVEGTQRQCCQTPETFPCNNVVYPCPCWSYYVCCWKSARQISEKQTKIIAKSTRIKRILIHRC